MSLDDGTHTEPVPVVGLRERKKARTRAAIQGEALRLFREQGYDNTTVQQIISVAEVSESTFFRYFPTKADLVLTDDFDPLIVEAFRSQPRDVSATHALRVAFREVFTNLSPVERGGQQDRIALMLAVPELRAAMLDQLASAMELLCSEVGERVGRSPHDLRVQTLAGAVIGVAIAVTLTIADDPSAELDSLMDEAMGYLEEGFEL